MIDEGNGVVLWILGPAVHRQLHNVPLHSAAVCKTRVTKFT